MTTDVMAPTPEKQTKPSWTQTLSKPSTIIAIVLWAVGAVVAGWLSWSCSSNWQRGLLRKLFFAFFSFVQSWTYVIYYVFFKWGACNPASWCRSHKFH